MSIKGNDDNGGLRVNKDDLNNSPKSDISLLKILNSSTWVAPDIVGVVKLKLKQFKDIIDACSENGYSDNCSCMICYLHRKFVEVFGNVDKEVIKK